MKKHFTLLLLAAAFALTASAQKTTGLKLNVAAESLIPMGDASEAYSVGLGGSLKLEVPIAQSLDFTVNAGYTSLFYSKAVKDLLRYFGDNSTSGGIVPLQAGFKYHFVPQFYAEGSAGAVISTQSGGSTVFAYSPGVGVIFPLQSGNAIDAGFRYEGWSKNGESINFIGIRVAYKFSL